MPVHRWVARRLCAQDVVLRLLQCFGLQPVRLDLVDPASGIDDVGPPAASKRAAAGDEVLGRRERVNGADVVLLDRQVHRRAEGCRTPAHRIRRDMGTLTGRLG
jgi:hypothetical protein